MTVQSLLARAGFTDVFGRSPQLLQASLNYPNFLKAVKGGMIGVATISPSNKN